MRRWVVGIADWGYEFFVGSRAPRGSQQKTHTWIKQRLLFSWLVSPMLSTWTVLLPMLMFGARYSIANVPRMNALLSSAPPALAGTASATNNAIAQIGNAMGIAITVALVTTFGRNYYLGELQAAGLDEQQIKRVTDLLKQVLSSDIPSIASQFAIPVEQLEGLVGNYQAAFTTGVTQMLLVAAIALFLATVLIWFAFRSRQEAHGRKLRALYPLKPNVNSKSDE